MDDDRRTLEGAYLASYDRLVRLCERTLGDRSEAEDVVQEVFLRAAGPIVRRECDPPRYLTTAARNACLDILRRRGRRGTLRLQPDLPAPGPPVDKVALDREELRQAWAGLSRRDQALLAQRYAGFAYGDIAHRSRLSPKVVSVGLVRARERLRASMRSAGAVVAALASWRGRRAGWMSRATRPAGRWVSAMARPGAPEFSVVALMALVGSAGAGAAGAVAGGGARVSPALVRADEMPAGRAAGTSTLGRLETVATNPRAPKSAAHPAPSGAAAAVPGVRILPRTSDVYINSLSPSPAYEQDHDVLADGYMICPACEPVLFASSDGGAHWSKLRAQGFGGGHVVFSPRWPTDRRLFAGTYRGLEESDDGGSTFHTVVPVPGPAAIQPAQNGAYRIVVAGALVWTYDPTSGSLAAGAAVPADLQIESIAPVDDGGSVVLGAHVIGSSGGFVLRCQALMGCQTVLDVPAASGAIQLETVVSSVGPRLIALAPQGSLYASSDGGMSFSPMPSTPAMAAVLASAPAGAATAFAVGTAEPAPGNQWHPAIHLFTADGAEVLQQPSQVPTPWANGLVALLPGGRILFVQSQGLPDPISFYSDDAGASWSCACAGAGNGSTP